MSEWWNRKKQKMRKYNKERNNYTFFDFIFDVLYWIPDLVFLPFRIIFWLLRGFGRVAENIFDHYN
ncbi:hypothetical protein [Peribacillus acanthi]|uniref:hypothetical protein n=1 Tax=Peribacillus acanthi TaxID=2171554 RepID=UPI000D3EB0FE|nr:hypothetical protein [Peribacillus acanthi]